MGQEFSARDFGSSERVENAGILDVFPIFHTARLGQKIRRKPQLPLCGIALEFSGETLCGTVKNHKFLQTWDNSCKRIQFSILFPGLQEGMYNEHIEVSTTRENIVNILKALLLMISCLNNCC